MTKKLFLTTRHVFLVTEITQEVEKGIVKNEILECYYVD